MRPIQKLEDLVDDIVPQHFAVNAPQFYELVKAFLRNLQDVQESIDSKFLDTIDYNRIKNIDYKKVYLQSHLAMFNLDEAENYESLGDMVKVAKDLGTLKGTSLLFSILLKLLVFIVPSIGNSYNLLLAQFNEETDPLEKALLEKQLNELKLQNLDGGKVLYSEEFDIDGNLVPFKYQIVADITKDMYEKYIKHFAHPAGWEDIFISAYLTFFSEDLEITTSSLLGDYESFILYDCFLFPWVYGDGEAKGDNLPVPQYPTGFYQRADLGAEADYATIAAKFTSTANLVIEGGRVLYDWGNLNNGATLVGTVGRQTTTAIYKTPTEKDFRATAGGYVADTTNIGTANGSLFGDLIFITYQIIIDDTKR